jgi:hypothetical protein
VCAPPSLLQDVANKKLERDKKPPLGFVPPQNIIVNTITKKLWNLPGVSEMTVKPHPNSKK